MGLTGSDSLEGFRTLRRRVGFSTKRVIMYSVYRCRIFSHLWAYVLGRAQFIKCRNEISFLFVIISNRVKYDIEIITLDRINIGFCHCDDRIHYKYGKMIGIPEFCLVTLQLGIFKRFYRQTVILSININLFIIFYQIPSNLPIPSTL